MEDEPETAKATLVRNERLKARATYLNGLAVATAAVGGLAPFTTSISNLSIPSASTAVIGSVCLLLSYALHSLAMKVLKGLEP